MTDPVFVALDQGGHATRASAYTASGELEGAALVTIATQRNALGHVEHDADEIVASARTALTELAHLVPVERWTAMPAADARSRLSSPGRTRGVRPGCAASAGARTTSSG